MAGVTVTSAGLAHCRAGQGTTTSIVTADAGVVSLDRCADQGVVMTGRAAGAADGDKAAVVETGCRMHCLPGPAMAGRAVASAGLAHCRADQDATVRIVTAGTSVVGLSRCADQCVIMTGRATGAADGDKAVVIEPGCRMHCFPGPAMAGRAVASAGLAHCRADQFAGRRIMTADAGVVSLGSCTDQGIVVAIGTAGRTDGNETAVVVPGCRMQNLPTSAMAGRTVACAGFAHCRADQFAGRRIVTADAGVVGRCIYADQGVVVAAGATGATDGDQTTVVERGGRMQSPPATPMTDGAIASVSRDTRFQRGRSGMTETAVTQMDQGNCPIEARTRVMTGQTVGRAAGHIP